MTTEEKLKQISDNVPKVYQAGYDLGELSGQKIITRTATELNNIKVDSIGQYAFRDYTTLREVRGVNVTAIGNYAFQHCTSLVKVDFPILQFLHNLTFHNCYSLTELKFPQLQRTGTSTFESCSSLTTVDLPLLQRINSKAFNGCPSLTSLILRCTIVCTLSSTDAFNGCTKINNGTGYIYVPKSLIETYKTATNWVTFADNFRALEDYTVDGTITGELDESKV